MIMISIGAFAGAAHAQFTVNITGPGYPRASAPASFTMHASTSLPPSQISKLVYYRNDVPYKSYVAAPFDLDQEVGQDTYTYRARVYNTSGVSVDSSTIKIEVYTPRIYKMGSDDNPKGAPTTQGPDANQDHTDDIEAALAYLASFTDGGTLLFPCKLPSGAAFSVYNIRRTISIPPNVTLQGESSEAFGKCRIYWHDVDWDPDNDPKIEHTPDHCYDNPDDGTNELTDNPMFKIVGGKSHVRFKDLWLYSRSSGRNCYPRYDWDRIDDEGTAAIQMNTDDYEGAGHITDVIFENVAINNFTHGIEAVSGGLSTYEISGIKIRGYRAEANHRQLYIDCKRAYDWDVQNLNLSGMMQTQGAVEILNAGRPPGYTGENGKLKFLELNCNGSADRLHPPAFCVQVTKHSGLYFRQLHHEGTPQAIIVQNNPDTNPDPIVFESSVATGEFYDDSMKLYLIGNTVFAAPEVAQPLLDNGRLRFFGEGASSTLMDCGDIHWDITDHDPRRFIYSFNMIFTHSERNRASFFAQDLAGNKFTKAHTYCSQGVSGLPNVNEIGGDYFDSGIMPTEAETQTQTERLYSNVLNASTPCPMLPFPSTEKDIALCLEQMMDYNDASPDNGGTVYIDGQFTVNRTVNVPSGAQIIGSPTAQLTLDVPNAPGVPDPLFQIDLPVVGVVSEFRVSGIAIRNLKLKPFQSSPTGTGIAMIGLPGAGVGGSSDIHFSGLTIEGFTTGLYGGVYNSSSGSPMIDGVSLKNMSFLNNGTAVKVYSQNLSNWNVMNLNISSSIDGAIGWNQLYGGHQGLQGVSCQGAPGYMMSDCIRLQMVGNFYLTDLKQNQVTNGLTVGENGSPFGDYPWVAPQYANLTVRNSDFTSSSTTIGRVNLIGKAFIVSLNNKYSNGNFSVGSAFQGNQSRVTYCGDNYNGGTPYAGLAERHPNLVVGAPTLTRVSCGTRPMPWDDVVRFGSTDGDKPLVGNFYDDLREDYVIYRSGAPSQFLIRQASAPPNTLPATSTINWGIAEDIPMIGRFYPNTRAQIVIWRPSTGDFWAYDPNTTNSYAWHWGMSGDVPFVGNFMAESGPGITGNKDEVAVYRKTDKTFYIFNPRSGESWARTTSAPDDSTIQVGDFSGSGYDQIAQYHQGVWDILDPRTGSTTTGYLGGQAGDIPVAGKYLTGPCTQLAVWRPTVQPGGGEPDRSEFIIDDPPFNCSIYNRGTSMIWGSNNEFISTGQYPDDIPLTINTADGSLRRPTVYRPTQGVFTISLSKGQWWVHDAF